MNTSENRQYLNVHLLDGRSVTLRGCSRPQGYVGADIGDFDSAWQINEAAVSCEGRSCLPEQRMFVMPFKM